MLPLGIVKAFRSALWRGFAWHHEAGSDAHGRLAAACMAVKADAATGAQENELYESKPMHAQIGATARRRSWRAGSRRRGRPIFRGSPTDDHAFIDASLAWRQLPRPAPSRSSRQARATKAGDGDGRMPSDKKPAASIRTQAECEGGRFAHGHAHHRGCQRRFR